MIEDVKKFCQKRMFGLDILCRTLGRPRISHCMEKKMKEEEGTEQRLEAMEKIRDFWTAGAHKISDDDKRGASKNMCSQCPSPNVK